MAKSSMTHKQQIPDERIPQPIDETQLLRTASPYWESRKPPYSESEHRKLYAVKDGNLVRLTL